MQGLLTKYSGLFKGKTTGAPKAPWTPRALDALQPYSTGIGLGIGGAAGAGTYALTGDPIEAGVIGAAAGTMFRPGTLRAKYNTGVNSVPAGGHGAHDIGLDALTNHAMKGVGTKALIAGGFAAGHALPKALDQGSKSLQNIQDFTSDLAQPQQELQLADGTKVPLSRQDAAKLQAMAPKGKAGPSLIDRYGPEVASGKAKLRMKPSGAAALQTGIGDFGAAGSQVSSIAADTAKNVAGSVTDTAKNVADTSGQFKATAAELPGLVKEVSGMAKNVGDLKGTVDTAVKTVDNRLGKLDTTANKAIDTVDNHAKGIGDAVTGAGNWAKQNANYLMGGGLTVAGLYALSQWYKARQEEAKREEARRYLQ